MDNNVSSVSGELFVAPMLYFSQPVVHLLTVVREISIFGKIFHTLSQHFHCALCIRVPAAHKKKHAQQNGGVY